MSEILNMQLSSASNELRCFATAEARTWQPHDLLWMFNEPEDAELASGQ